MIDLEIQKIIKDKSKEIVDEVSQLTPVCAKWRSGAEKTLTYPFDKAESDKWLYEIDKIENSKMLKKIAQDLSEK